MGIVQLEGIVQLIYLKKPLFYPGRLPLLISLPRTFFLETVLLPTMRAGRK